jgi:regulator of protease activity HflC (stomatin/prohibitin superfamily)
VGFFFVVVFFGLILLFMGLRMVQEYERGVIFRLGRLVGAKGPGLFWIWPVIDRMVKVDLRTITMELPAQEVISKDNVTIKVTAVLYFRVTDPGAAVTKVYDYGVATMQIAQTTLRNVLGQSALDEILSQRDQINNELQRIIDDQTEPWGIKVSTVEIKDVELPQSMQRVMAKQAEAEREKRAKLIHADGELQASQALAEAAAAFSREPAALQLRYMQTLVEISAEKNSTIIFPLPIDLIEPMIGLAKNLQKRTEPTGGQPPTA